MTQIKQSRPRWTPPRKFYEGKPVGTLDVLLASLDMARKDKVPFWQALLGVGAMAWTNPTTRSTNDLITASIWNTDMVDNLTWLHDSQPGARVKHSTTQSIATGADRTVVFDSETYDNDGIHSTVSNTGRLTCNTAGTYLIIGDFEWATAPATAEVSILKNGATKIAWYQMTNSQKRAIISTIYQLAVSDYVELIVNPSGTQTIQNVSDYSPVWMMQRIG